MKIRRLPEAIADVDAIFAFIAQDNLPAADRMVERIAKALDRVADFPASGALRPDAGINIRGVNVGVYVVYYRIIDDVIEVVRVLHGARDIRRLDDSFG